MLACKIDQIIERNAEIVKSNIDSDKHRMSPDCILSDSRNTKYFIGLSPEQFYILYSFLGPAKFNLNYWKGTAHNSKCKSKKKKKQQKKTTKASFYTKRRTFYYPSQTKERILS